MTMSYRCVSGHCQLVPSICKPRVLIIVALLLCWTSKNGSNADIHHRNHKSLQLKAHPSFLKEAMLQSLGERGFDDGSEEMVGGFIGNPVDETERAPPPTKQKRSCGGMPSVATRGLVGPTLKRSYFATTKEEVEEKMRDEKRKKREVKRSETNEPALPWTCETKYEWQDMGADHYPRFVRTAECKRGTCFNGFFRCRARRYKTKILKRVTPSDSTSCEEDDVSLPESLRPHWKFVTVTISLCCDCVGRVPGTPEV